MGTWPFLCRRSVRLRLDDHAHCSNDRCDVPQGNLSSGDTEAESLDSRDCAMPDTGALGDGHHYHGFTRVGCRRARNYRCLERARLFDFGTLDHRYGVPKGSLGLAAFFVYRAKLSPREHPAICRGLYQTPIAA